MLPKITQVTCTAAPQLPHSWPQPSFTLAYGEFSGAWVLKIMVWCFMSERWCGPKPSPTKERRNVVNSFPDNLHEVKLSPVSGNGLIKVWNYGEFCFIVLRHSPVMLSKYQQPLTCLCVTKSAVFHFTLAPSKFTYVLHIDGWQNQRSDL